MRVKALLATLAIGSALILNPVKEMETITEIPQYGYKLYPTCGIVTEISETEWTFTDFGGKKWPVKEDPEDWSEGDIVAAIMSDNGTPETNDDIIIQTRYSGWVY